MERSRGAEIENFLQVTGEGGEVMLGRFSSLWPSHKCKTTSKPFLLLLCGGIVLFSSSSRSFPAQQLAINLLDLLQFFFEGLEV